MIQGTLSHTHDISVNIAKYGVVSQESTAYNGDASKAIDGNRDGNFRRCAYHPIKPDNQLIKIATL